MKEIARQNLGSAFNEEYLDKILEEDDHGAPLYVLSIRPVFTEPAVCCIKMY